MLGRPMIHGRMIHYLRILDLLPRMLHPGVIHLRLIRRMVIVRLARSHVVLSSLPGLALRFGSLRIVIMLLRHRGCRNREQGEGDHHGRALHQPSPPSSGRTVTT